MDKRELTAYHEAGHAVIAYRFGHRFENLSIKPEKKRSGFFRPWKKTDNAEHEVLMLFAGDAAQKHFCPNDKSNPSISDYRRIWHLTDSKRPEAYPELMAKAKKLVVENWAQIQAVAEALLETDLLNDGLVAVIIEAVDNGDNWRKQTAWMVHKEWDYGD